MNSLWTYALALSYLLLPAMTWLRTRSLAWTVVALAGAVAVVGASINFAIDRGASLTRPQMQLLLLGVLLAVFIVALVRPGRALTPMFRQILTVILPVALVLLLVVVTTTLWTEEFAFLRPVGFLMGHATAEDNAKWLDFTAQWATGNGIDQAVPLGGPLQLFLTFTGTLMGAISHLVLGGFNEVAVAANTVIYGQFLLVALMPLAFAVMAETKFTALRRDGGDVDRGRIPAPLLWAGMLVLSTASLAVMAYGHLTLQFTFLVGGLWIATFLSPTRFTHARFLTSLAAAASMTVWLPLNVIAVVIVVAWIAYFARRVARAGFGAIEWWQIALLAVVTIGIFQPVVSSLNYLLIGSQAMGIPVGVAGGVGAAGPAVADSILFAATGGTEAAGPLLMVAAIASVLGAAIALSRVARTKRQMRGLYVSFGPLALFALVAVAIYVLDAWATGAAPHYGSMKFTFMVAAIGLATTLPIALLLLDPRRVAAMTLSRWVAVFGVVVLLMVDSLLPRAIAQIRPEQWSPPIPFDNTSGSYWWPAEVNGQPEQPIASNPVACVYLPEGYPAPTAIVPSGLSDAQRVYACTRQLMGLGGLDFEGLAVVNWLRREWFSNTPAWSAVYDTLANMEPEVLDRPVILLDDGSNVKGVETLRSLLNRYPKDIADG